MVVYILPPNAKKSAGTIFQFEMHIPSFTYNVEF